MLRKMALLGLATAALAAWPAAARADKLDNRLKDEMDKVVKYLRAKGHKNVGVLPFRAIKGERKSSFRAGPINTNMATRLENALVIHGGDSEAKAFGVIHDAGVAARQQGKAGVWFTGSQQQKDIDSAVAQRKKMFNTAMPLAWGNKKVKPDVLLTGVVINAGDRTKTTVRIEAIDRKNPARLDKVTEFTVPTDRSLVRDLGYNFALSRSRSRSMVRKRTQENEEGVLEQAKQQDKKQQSKQTEKPQSKQDGVPTPASVAGIEFAMVVDGKPAEIKASDTQNAKYSVTSPRAGSKVWFTLKNNDKEQTLGVVLKLNGVSTIDEQKDESLRCRKWVIEPGKTFRINGFYLFPSTQQKGGQGNKGGQGEKGGQGDKQGDADDDQQKKDQQKKDQQKKDQDKKDQPKSKVKTEVKPFKVLVGEDAHKMMSQLGDKAGVIEIDVFVAGQGGEEEGDKTVSYRGAPQPKERKARSSHSAYRLALMQAARLKTKTEQIRDRTTGKVTKREVIVADEEKKVPGGDIEVVSFDNPRAIGGLTIKIVPAEGDKEPSNVDNPGGDQPKGGQDPGPND